VSLRDFCASLLLFFQNDSDRDAQNIKMQKQSF
jgi:hypothetical protein